MLYVTTRNDSDTVLPSHVVCVNRGDDGGLFLPFEEAPFSKAELKQLLDQPFNSCVSGVLNRLFDTSLTGWDLDFSTGRRPVRLQDLGHRVTAVEAWHNPAWTFDGFVQNVRKLLSNQLPQLPGNWCRIAVRAAVLFGVFSEMNQAGSFRSMDISVVAGDFSAPASAWYARKWGLPIGNIICCCNENNNLWELFTYGQMRTDAVSIPTETPEADITLPTDLERLVYAYGGVAEVDRYLDACRAGRLYTLDPQMLEDIRSGFYVSVVSNQRMRKTVPGVYRTKQYLFSPYGAMAYAGLQDYRAKTGETRQCLILSEKSPVCDRETVSSALGIEPMALENYL